MAESVVQLRCGIKNDPWGKKGRDSLAARLWEKTEGNGPIDDNTPYSEMWMGTYPSNPSYLLSSGEPLAEYLKKNPHVIGKSVLDRWGPEIPFLPKILSFCKALSLQIHPDKALAEKLHQKDPSKFGDTNHKPEIAVALAKFELFVGWKPLKDIEELFKLKPLEKYASKHGQFSDETLRETCRALLLASPDEVKETIAELQKIPESRFGEYTYIPSMLDRLSKQYSEFDNGNLVATLLMNYMTLNPGQAISIPADGIHAYLHGDIVECMARSDNVLNTGFCPRPERDNVDLFTQALTFKPHSPQEALLPVKKSPKGVHGKTQEYAPPISEFNVLATQLQAWENETHTAINGPSLMIVIRGDGRMDAEGKRIDLHDGDVFFVGQGISLDFSTELGLLVYRAYIE
ncbi:hypothetical protein VTO42DRAFT_3049 [Malbranchea cinnamomea]